MDERAVLCTTQGTNRPPKETEVHLNGSDGLNWKTPCRCGSLWLVKKSSRTRKRGSVTPIRRRQMADRINARMG
jgi:hypothetical protein